MSAMPSIRGIDRTEQGEEHFREVRGNEPIGPRGIGAAGAPAKRLWALMTPSELALFVGMFGIGAVPRDLHDRANRMIKAMTLLDSKYRLGQT